MTLYLYIHLRICLLSAPDASWSISSPQRLICSAPICPYFHWSESLEPRLHSWVWRMPCYNLRWMASECMPAPPCLARDSHPVLSLAPLKGTAGTAKQFLCSWGILIPRAISVSFRRRTRELVSPPQCQFSIRWFPSVCWHHCLLSTHGSIVFEVCVQGEQWDTEKKVFSHYAFLIMRIPHHCATVLLVPLLLFFLDPEEWHKKAREHSRSSQIKDGDYYHKIIYLV